MKENTNEISMESNCTALQSQVGYDIICQVTQCLFGGNDFQESITGVSEIIREYLKTDHLYILTQKGGERHNHICCTLGLDSEDSLITVSNAVVEHVSEHHKTVVIFDTPACKDFSADPQLQRFNIHAVLCVPLKSDNSIFGLLYADSRNTQEWSEETIEIIEHLGSIIGSVIEVEKLREQVAQDARPARTGRAMIKLSHSVKNILQMIGGAAEVVDFALATDQIPRVRKSWEILKPNLEKLRKFTLEMLEYGKEQELELQPCDFNRIVEGAVESLKPLFKQKKVKCNLELEDDLPAVKLDSGKIHEMALNLIIHTLDEVDEKKGVVNIETKNHIDENAVNLIISDNGSGLGNHTTESLFVPAAPGSKKFSTALGMPIAKEIIDRHGGNVRIESGEKNGTRYIITLPSI